ncbi:hypothetical protein JCM10212_005346 [Sporobolomyces blumeae]
MITQGPLVGRRRHSQRRRSSSAPVVAALAALSLLSTPTTAFWRLPCQGKPLVTERADPLTNPGSVSQHVHVIHGGSNFNLDMDFETARKGECASCKVKQDMSNYWTPQLYFQWKNGSFTSVPGGGLLVYYLQRSHEDDEGEVLGFPEGMRMLAGNPYVRSYNESSLMAKAIGWNCLGGDQLGMEETRIPTFPPVNCPNGLRGEIMFPSCWDGENVDSANHISHMAYPFDNEAGPCPSSHPKRVVTIFYEIVWDVDHFESEWDNAMNTSQPFVLSTGDPLGYGYHGDFLNGWDVDVLQKAVTECTADSGVIEECPVFDFFDWDNPLAYNTSGCIQSPAISETVLGTIDVLPGSNPVDYGPGDVTVSTEENPPSIEGTVEVSGYLMDQTTMLDVVISSSSQGGETSGGGGSGSSTGGSGGSSGSSDPSSSPSTTSSSAGADGDDAGSKGESDASPAMATSSAASAASSAGSSSSLTTSSLMSNKPLILCLVILLPVLVFVAIVLFCKFSCGRNRKKTLAREKAEDEELARQGESPTS